LDEKTSTVVLGLVFLILLTLSYVENVFFFNSVGGIFHNYLLGVGILFIHNVLVVSLILLGMTFYVNLVFLGFFKQEKYAHVVIDHSKIFAFVFTIMIFFLSVLRGSSLLGGVSIEALPLILLVSAPIGIVEGYGIYLTIEKTLSRTMSTRALAYVYCIFLVAAVMEVGFINILVKATTN